jgi:hypothetical protein
MVRAISQTRLGDKPRIFHRDHRLRREVLQQRDLLVGERPHFLTVNVDRAEHGIVPAKGDRQKRASAADVDKRSAVTPNAAPHNVIALSSIASNTGARSPGEPLMTCNTSAVAVCWSSASRVSIKSRAFSLAITACAAKFCNSAICFSENGLTSRRAATMRPRTTLSFRSWIKRTVRRLRGRLLESRLEGTAVVGPGAAEQGQHWDVVVPHMLVETALVIERFRPSLEQRTSAGDARQGLAQPLARDAVVAIAVNRCRKSFPSTSAQAVYPRP